MPRNITAAVEEYEKDGETKKRYVNIGVILEGEYGEYMLLDPTVDLAGVMLKQRLMNPKKAGTSVLCSIWDNDDAPKSKPKPDASTEELDDGIPF